MSVAVKTQAPEDARTPNLLIVEDDQGVSALLARAMSRRGFTVSQAYTGEQALSIAAREIDLMTLDFALPDLRGREVIDAMRRDQIEIPFVVVTGHGDERTAVEMMHAGARDYIVKDTVFLDLLPELLQRLWSEIQNERRLDELERQLRQSQKMEAFGQLAGGVAHDFNNILQAIFGYTSLASREGIAEEERLAHLKEIRLAADRASSLTRQMLAFSRKQTLQLCDFDASEAIDNLIKMIKRIIGEDIELNYHPADEPCHIHADNVQLDQILMNLCVNARDAMPGGGQLTIETSRVKIESDYTEQYIGAAKGEYVLISVTDTGYGMDEATRQRVFEPFFTTKAPGAGTGLGLSTVYGLVKQHKGMVHVYSELGQGSSFKVYLPLVRDAMNATFEKEDHSAPGGEEMLLLAEDDAMVRRLGERILCDAGYTVLSACNGEEAVTLYREHAGEIALVIMDLVMPVMSGRDACEAIRKLDPESKVLFTSGYTAKTLHSDFLDQQKITLLQKPYDALVLLRRVRKEIDHPPIG